jgi:SPP1 gp7 family putative phage head morphogenesis protein
MATETATDPIELLVRRLLLIQRWGNTVSAQANARIEELFREIVAAVTEGGVGSGNLQGFRAVIEGQIDALTPAAYEDVLRIVQDGATEFGVQQGRAAVVQLRAALGAAAAGGVELVAVTLEQIRQIVTAEPIVGAPLEAWYRGQSDRVRFKLKREIQLGMTRAETIDDLVRRIRGKHTGKYRTIQLASGATRRVGVFSGGVLTASTREAEAIARTAVNHVSNRASLEVFRANADVAPRVRYTATLDSRVSVLCASLDSQEWAMEDPALRVPPLHPNCRSVLTPVVDWKALGMDPPPEGTRASKDGQVPADLSAEDWLRDAPNALQDDVLGPARAKLFREGRVSLRDLVRTDGGIVSLDELRAA